MWKVKLSLSLTKHQAMETCSVEGRIAPRLLNCGNRWRWVVSLTPRPLHSQGKSPWYLLNRRLGGPQSRFGRDGEEKNSQPPPGIEPQNSDRPARSPALHRLSYDSSISLNIYSGVQRHLWGNETGINMRVSQKAKGYFKKAYLL
jgi:hypothetical protein